MWEEMGHEIDIPSTGHDDDFAFHVSFKDALKTTEKG